MSSMTTASLPNASEHDCKQDFSYLWTMYYRHGMNASLTKGFYYKGDIYEAGQRAREHCRIMGYRYIFIRPMIVDINADEEYKLGGGGELNPWRLKVPSLSKKQRRLMAIAEHHPSEVYPKNRGVLKMSHQQLHDFASTKEKNLPLVKKASSKIAHARKKSWLYMLKEGEKRCQVCHNRS